MDYKTLLELVNDVKAAKIQKLRNSLKSDKILVKSLQELKDEFFDQYERLKYSKSDRDYDRYLKIKRSKDRMLDEVDDEAKNSNRYQQM